MMMTPAAADALKDEIAPTGKLRVAIAISPAGGAFWSTKTETGYAGVPVDLGKAMAEQLGVPVEYVAHNNSGQIVDAVSKGTWDITFLPKDPEREGRMAFGPIYEVADATYIVKPGSQVTNFATLDQPGIKVAAVNNTTTMRGAIAHLKNAKGQSTHPQSQNGFLEPNCGWVDAPASSGSIQFLEETKAIRPAPFPIPLPVVAATFLTGGLAA
jgi:polar amino acid transport system substrate-binding protein